MLIIDRIVITYLAHCYSFCEFSLYNITRIERNMYIYVQMWIEKMTYALGGLEWGIISSNFDFGTKFSIIFNYNIVTVTIIFSIIYNYNKEGKLWYKTKIPNFIIVKLTYNQNISMIFLYEFQIWKRCLED